jgi:hypothetical protein
MPIRISKTQPDNPAPEGGTATIEGAQAVHNPLVTGSQGYRSTTPLPDYYTTTAIVEALKFWVPPNMFLLDNFFGVERFYKSRFLGINTRRAKRVLAPVVSRFHRGVVVKRPPVETNFYEVPKLAPYRTIFLSELDMANLSNTVATQGSGDATDIYADLLADDTHELSDLIMRRTELFASQILNYGKVRYRLDGGAYEEFGYGADVPTEFTPTVPWTDHQNATPITDLKAVRKQIIAATGLAPDLLVMSDAVADNFTACDQVLTQLDRLHYIVGQIEPARPKGTAQWLGRLLLPALEMWAYSEEYIDEFDGVSLAPMIPEHRCIVGVTQPSGYQYWGSILQMDTGGFEESGNTKLIPRLLYDLKNEVSEYRLQARPALVPLDAATWTVINAFPPPPPPPRKVALPTEATEPEPRNRKGGK